MISLVIALHLRDDRDALTSPQDDIIIFAGINPCNIQFVQLEQYIRLYTCTITSLQVFHLYKVAFLRVDQITELSTSEYCILTGCHPYTR